jgi:tetratricopeptide (TPR) repeat protein
VKRLTFAELVGWAGIFLGLVVMLRFGKTDGPLAIVVITAVLVATAALIFWRSLAGLERLQSLLVEGRPKPMLRIVRRRLRYRGGGANRAELLIYQAAAYAMSGEFDKGLLALDDIGVPGELPVEDRESWLFAYASTRFSCLLFSEQIEAARSLYEETLLGYRKHAELEVVIEAMEGELLYCEGEHIKAERILEALVSETRTPPAARAVFHYFLGRIYADRGQRARAAAQFDLARTLGPRTWIPAGIDALEAAAK